MAKIAVDALIDRTRSKFEDNNIVAFLGTVGSGKTVVSALLYYQLIKDWIPKSNERWEAVANSGDDEINEIIRDMKQGRFPNATLQNNFPQLTVNIYSMEGRPSESKLILRDISGENFTDMLTQDENTDEILYNLLTEDGAYLAYAKQYVIMIDCGIRKDWDTDICRVAKMLAKIKEIKQKIHHLSNDEPIHAPIAIVFTKTDLLTPAEQELSPKELLAKYPALRSSLAINHDKNRLNCFKVKVESKKESDDEEKERVLIDNEKIQKEYENKINIIQEQIDTAIEQAQKSAEEQARVNGMNEDQIIEEGEKAKEQVQEENRKQLEFAQEENREQLEEIKTEGDEESSWKVNKPLRYSEDEYNDLISWIITSKRD